MACPGEDLVHQIPSLPGSKRRQMPGVGPGRCLSFDLIDTLRLKISSGSYVNSLFSRDVMYISKCKIAEPLSFQLSLVIEHPKHISF